MRFSLVIATIGRVNELKELFHSLASQTCQDFEVVVVDQNSDDRLCWVENHQDYTFPIMRLRSTVRHSSLARNAGLHKASGEIVGFPDDDCIYPPDLLESVTKAFGDDDKLGVRTGPSASPNGGLGSGRWHAQSVEIDITNVWNTVIEFNIFIRRDLVLAIGGFDDQLGVGGPFGSAEGNDLVMRALKMGWRGWYEITQLAIHPDKKMSSVAVERAFVYGSGLGYVLRKHSVPARIWLNFMIRPLGGYILNLAFGRRMVAQYYWRTLCGRTYGFRAYRSTQKALV